MEINKTIVIKPLLIVLGLVIFTIGVSYAYFQIAVSGNETTQTIAIDGSLLSIKYNSTETITATNVIPGWTGKKYFNVVTTNNSNKEIIYNINLNITKSNFYTTDTSGNSYLNYSLNECTSSSDKTCSTNITSTTLINIQSGKKTVETITSTKSETKYYVLILSFPNEDVAQKQTGTDGNSLVFNSYLTIETNTKASETMWTYNYQAPSTSVTEPYYTFTAPQTGTYKLETWGAQGGGDNTYIGGYGGYSTGTITLSASSKIYVYIGGAGSYCFGKGCNSLGGYNGGGNCTSYASEPSTTCGSGGGATHIATKTGLLSTLSSSLTNILIVSGSGGGANYVNGMNYASGGSGGGYKGVDSVDMGAKDFSANGGLYATGGNQSSGYAFGIGQGRTSSTSVGGGGGYYGGKGSTLNGAGGGSSYIGNTLLTNKAMYCYNCTESSDTSTKTTSTTCHSNIPTENCAKEGNGYARITLIS